SRSDPVLSNSIIGGLHIPLRAHLQVIGKQGQSESLSTPISSEETLQCDLNRNTCERLIPAVWQRSSKTPL
ncbi:MAG: hypothetical protein ACKPKO_32950, partial [Candidatus Fonsibacter sp.]